ncbi:hypothetical protein C8R44DRAFT_30875 [Mycena epipterygia]|nr:hypothetical protein C8R44DRAFT_30875 [Mycena epipterygia]
MAPHSNFYLEHCWAHKIEPRRRSFFRNVILKSTIGFVSLTLCINLICTGLIAFRLFHAHREVLKLCITRSIGNVVFFLFF